jgi:RNA polymerase sigma factor (sigma-70 family)
LPEFRAADSQDCEPVLFGWFPAVFARFEGDFHQNVGRDMGLDVNANRSADPNTPPAPPSKGEWFATTHWSVVLAAGRSDSEQRAAALQQLCNAYWYPLYAYIRWRGSSPEDAQDLTQGFFLQLIEKNWLAGVAREGARFRSFLLTMLKGFLANARDHAQALKRGGGRLLVPLDSERAEDRLAQEPSTNETPETAFERRWALAVLGEALQRLRLAAGAADKARHFDSLHPFLSREPANGEYAALAVQLNISPGAVGVAVHRLRQRYREMLRATVADTLADPRQIDDEMRHVLAALTR